MTAINKNPEPQNITPMVSQYLEIKKNYPDSLLFFRLGDFYELFYQDAEIVSKELGLVLTKRVDMPMCGIPHHAHEMYITRLINSGFKVAICDQLETPEEAKLKRGYKATIKRGVTRIISRGTITESAFIDSPQNSFLLAISSPRNKINYGIAYADISTGVFKVEKVSKDQILDSIARVNPAEIICSDSLLENSEMLFNLQKYQDVLRSLPSFRSSEEQIQQTLTKFYNVEFIETFGELPKECLEASSLILSYLNSAYVDAPLKLNFPKLIKSQEFMQIDHFSRKSLELLQSISSDKKATLFQVINKTLTAQGSRLLSEWLANPLYDLSKIQKRLDFVELFFNDKLLLGRVRFVLENFPDIERALSRVYMDRGGPKDLLIIRKGLEKIRDLDKFLQTVPSFESFSLSSEAFLPLISILQQALEEENLPNLAGDGGFIKKGYDSQLEEYRDLIQNSTDIIQGMQKRYSEETGIFNLKIKQNGILGYFIETSANHVRKIPYDFIHKQTLSTCIRYTTRELSIVAEKIATSELNSKRREFIIFEELCAKVKIIFEKIKQASQKVSFIDSVSSLAFLAQESNYVKPEIVEENILEITDGRHPVVEARMSKEGERFVSNDCSIDSSSLISIVTGPNMGGKSTFLRQNAIIIILAQMGSFVPASKAVIGLVDKIFSRVGANDDISSGKSTFMVEMIETSIILNQASSKSFVILDEIGRGTSTYDGLSIAWAVIEHLHSVIQSRTLFATHYHELRQIKEVIPNVKFLNVCVAEEGDNISFLHKINEGFADKSYGIHVAKLAGFPQEVVTKAQNLLDKVSSP